MGFEHVEWFNGGFFDSNEALPLDSQDTKLVLQAARLDWSDIDPSIFGTLFERDLDPDKRSQLGAHYADRDEIMMLVEPVSILLISSWLRVRRLCKMRRCLPCYQQMARQAKQRHNHLCHLNGYAFSTLLMGVTSNGAHRRVPGRHS